MSLGLSKLRLGLSSGGGAAAVPVLENPTLYLAGASLESLNYFGLASSWYGYNPCYWLFWADALDAQCMFNHLIVKKPASANWWTQGTNYAEEGSTYSTASPQSWGLRSISGQVDAIIAAASGTNNAVFVSTGRNGITAGDSAATIIAQHEDMVDRLIDSGKFGLIMVPELTMRNTAVGGLWASGGANRQIVLDVNAGLATMAASRPLVELIDWFDTFSDAGGDRNAKSGYQLSDGTHDTPKGGYAKGRYLKDKIAARVTAQAYPSRSGDDLLTAFSGTGGSLANSATGTVPTGYTFARATASDTMTAALAYVSGTSGTVRATVTPNASQPNTSDGAVLRSTVAGGIDLVAGTNYIVRARVQVPITTVSYALSLIAHDFTGGSNQQFAFGPGVTTDGFAPNSAQPASGALQAWPGDVAHDLFLRTPMMLAPAGSPKGLARFWTYVNQGTATALPIDVLDMQFDPQ
jgi:hypothetical protein